MAPHNSPQAAGLVGGTQSSVVVLREGQTLTLHSGDPLLVGDIVQSGSVSVDLEMANGSVLQLQPHAETIVDEGFLPSGESVVATPQPEVSEEEQPADDEKKEEKVEPRYVESHTEMPPEFVQHVAQEVDVHANLLDTDDQTRAADADRVRHGSGEGDDTRHGPHDTTVNAADDTATAVEDQQGATTGNVLGNDDADAKVVTKVAQGQYGTVLFNSDGTFSYRLNTAAQHLAEGQVVTDPVKYEVIDPAGNKTTATLTVAVTGTNDVPTLDVLGVDSTHGTLQGHDTDTQDSLTYSVDQGAGHFGTLSVDPASGAYTYTPNQSVQGMTYDPNTNSYHGQDTFTVKVDDGHGGEATKTLTFDASGHVSMVNGTLTPSVNVPTPTPGNTPPAGTPGQAPSIASTGGGNTGAGTTGGSSSGGHQNQVTIDLDSKSDSGTSDSDNLTNDTTPTITGTTTVPFSTVEIFDGSTSLGQVTSDATGHYSFTPTTPLGEAVHNLHAVATDLTGTSGQSSDLGVTVDTSAHGDARILDGQASGHADSYLNAAEQIHAKIASVHMEAGSKVDSVVVTDSHGNAVSIPQHVIDASMLGGGRVLMLKDVDLSSLSDGTLTVEIKGHDAAGNSFSSTDSISKDTTTSITADLVDASDTGDSDHDNYTKDNTPTIEGKAEAGSIVVITDAAGHEVGRGTADASGNYSITTSQLPDGLMQKLTITSTDTAGNTAQTTQAISIDTQVAPLKVEGMLHDTGAKGDFITSTDPSDTSSNLKLSGFEAGAHIQYSTDGGTTWQSDYHPHEGQNDFLIRQVDYAGNESVPTPVSYVVDNTVVAPTVALVTDTGSSSTDMLTQDGHLNVTGVEAGAKVEYSTDGGTTWSTSFTAAEGANNVQVRQTDVAGNVSPAAHISFTLDTTAHATDATASATEDQTTDSTGSITLEAGTQVTSTDVQGQYGTYHFKPDGSFTYTLDNTNPAVQALKAGEPLSDPVQYSVTDAAGNTATATVTTTITGTNDGAVIGGLDTGDIYENKAGVDISPDYAQPGMAKITNTLLYADGRLTITDTDAGEGSFKETQGFDYHGQYGQLRMLADGTWHYNVHLGGATGSAIDQLGSGQSVVDKITVYSKDGTSHEIAVTIHGDNDAPYCSATVQLNSGTEDQAMTLTTQQLLANTHDVDANDAGKLNIQNLKADHGSIHDNGDGTYTFTPDKDYNGQVHFTYDVADGHGGVTHTDATTSLQAVNDAATITDAQTDVDQRGVTEDKGYIDTHDMLNYHGHLNINDPDAGEAKFDVNKGPQTYVGIGYDTQLGGHVLLQPNGDYIYTINNTKPNIQALGDGETLTDHVTVRSEDGTTKTIALTIHGTNDAPEVSWAVTLSQGTEDTDYTLHTSDLLANATDTDTLDQGHLSVHNLQADHGTITDNHDGTFTFHPDKDYNGQVNFTYDVQDPHGASVATSASMNLAAVSDAAVITGTGQSITEDHGMDYHNLIHAYGKLTVVDPDGPAQSKFEDPLYHGLWKGSLGGELQINEDGAYIYTMNNARIDHLSEGQVVKDHFVVHSVDGTTHVLDFTITGTNDAPKIGQNAFSTTEGDSMVHGQLQFTDDDLDTHTFGVTNAPAGFHLDPNTGSYTFDPTDPAYNHIADGQTEVVRFNVTVTDNNGLTSTREMAFDITGTNDAPTVSSAVILASGTEDTSVTLTEAQLLANTTDVDGDTLSVDNLRADHGTITKIADGTFSFTPDANYNGAVQFTYDVTDGHGGSVTQTASMNLAAVADNPHPTVDIADTADNVLNASEAAVATITGSIEPGSWLSSVVISDGVNLVTVTNVAVDAQGNFTLYNVDLSSLSDGTLIVSANAVSQDGTTGTSTDTIVKDGHIGDVAVSFENAGGDGMYSKAEVGSDGTVTATITLPQDAVAGDTLTINRQDHILTAQEVAAGHYQFEAHPSDAVLAILTDQAGNQSTVAQAVAASMVPDTPTFVAPPVINNYGTPTITATLDHGSSGGWALQGPNGQPVQQLTGKYGTLSIDPNTGQVNYQYDHGTTMGSKMHGGTHSAGQSISQTDHDVFHVLLHSAQHGDVDVEVNVNIQFIHGRSGQNVDSTQLMGMTITDPTGTVQHDEPDQNIDQVDDVSITIGVDSDDQPSDDSGDAPMPPPPPPANEMEFDLCNAAKLLDEQPKPVASGMEEALKSAATLLDDTQVDSKEAELVKAVENAEGKEHVANPNAPDRSADTSGEQNQEEQSAEYVPDMHNVVNDHDQNDGSGIKG